MTELTLLVKQRGRVKAKLTNFSNFIQRVDGSSEHGGELPLRIEKAEGLLAEFETIQNRIEDLDEAEAQQIERQEFEDRYYQLITAARRLQIHERAPPLQAYQNVPMNAQHNIGNEQFVFKPAVRLPTIELPKFDGNYEFWIPFRDLFESLIASNPSIPAVQKLHYLRSALSGEAAKVIASLEITSHNYEVAWNSLKQRFENKKLITHHLIQTLLDMPPIPRESHADLRQLADNISQITQNLAKLGQPIEHFAIWVIHIMLPKIDKNSRREWEFKRSDNEEFPTLDDFINFLISRSACLEAVFRASRIAQPLNDNRNNKSAQGQGKNISRSYVTSNNTACSICSNDHKIHECSSFLKMAVNDRNTEIRKKRLCVKCLKQYHGKGCKASNCQVCKGYHHTLLHKSDLLTVETNNKETKSQNESQAKKIDNDNARKHSTVALTADSSVSLNHCAFKGPSQVLLSTAILFIHDSEGNLHKCRALLDSGSQSNFITKKLYNKLKLRFKTIDRTITGISNMPISAAQQINAIIQSRTSAYQVKIPLVVIDQITDRLPTFKINKDNLDIPSNLDLADPNYYIPGDIDILLGASIFWNLLQPKQIKKSNKQPILQQTSLGWIISGNVQANDAHHQHHKIHCGVSTNINLRNQLEKFWQIEELQQPELKSQEEIQCEEHFNTTHSRRTDGRFVVHLPMKDGIQKLGESYKIAEKRLKSLELKLERQPDVKRQYHDFMREYHELNHMLEVPAIRMNDKPNYYIPHHAVIKEDSTTTKLRVVFDASCKTTSGQSLNDFLKTGSNLQEDLFDIVVRLRQHKYALAADITKMYRQVEVTENHRKLQRILWRWSRQEPIRTFELTTVTYGLSSSSFLAIRSLQEAAHQLKEQYPRASEIILKDFYVDDLLTGANSIEELKKIKHEVTSILTSAKFSLNKWKSNARGISNSDGTENTVKLGEATKILGIWWNTNTDTFHYRINLENDPAKITKRYILSKIAEIYDPLGWIGPVVVRAKIIMQRLWQMKKDWDDDITGDTHKTWIQWRAQIKLLEDIIIPRKILCDNPTQIEIHGFCDASEAAYGACVYLRSTNAQGKYEVNLLCAKSRIAPIKKISLPRLELCGATLLAHLCQKVVQALNVQVHNTYYWSDSMIALSWIISEANKWHTFVANRVAEISRITNNAPWYHVKSEENPADPLSRGTNPEKIKSMQLWWKGPSFLHRNTSLQPFKSGKTSEEVPEGRTISLLAQDKTVKLDSSIIQRFSSLIKLKRVIAYCLRFKSNASSSNRTNQTLTVQELNKALISAVKICQASEFHQELHDLQDQKKINSKSKILTLHPFLDDKGIIRVGGRLRHAPIEYSRKYPIILPNKHHLTELIIRDAHYRNLHAGPQAILADIRNNYWPVSGKDAIRRVLRKCIVCYRVRPILATQLMGDLPTHRVTQARPFLNTGVDYAGPFSIKVSRNKTGKAYLSIFICLATKAVHFELVPDLTTASFLNAIKRFIARRGKCLTLYSDNSTTFVGANNQLAELKEFFAKETTQAQLNEYLVGQFVTWKFIPPHSPHMGGIWEAAVKSAKTHMKKIIGTTVLSFEELLTVLLQIEACLNSRPLTPITNDPTDLQALTPGHFIIGEALNAMPEHDLKEVPLNRLTRYQLITQIKQNFWSRWSQEYISQLHQRFKWKHIKDTNVKVGTMVLIKNENTPPIIWPLGRIVEIHPGLDGVIRVVTIKTGHGVTKRALSKLCILPIDDNIQN